MQDSKSALLTVDEDTEGTESTPAELTQRADDLDELAARLKAKAAELRQLAAAASQQEGSAR